MIKSFLYQLFRFLSPLFIFLTCFLILIIYLDPFKVFFEYEDYNDTFVNLNRNIITARMYQKNKDKEHFDSFIFGSSRSQAFKAVNWKNHLEKEASPFHFDASLEGLYGITSKIQYIDKQGDSIKNALLILDLDVVQKMRDNSGNLFISVPEISGNSKIDFYLTYIKSSFNTVFLMAYIDYSIFRKYRVVYMGFFIMDAKYPHIINQKTADMWYGYDQHIAIDSAGYYNERTASGVFYEREKTIEREMAKSTVSEIEKEQLATIKSIFDKHKTSYKIVIAPLYDQIPLEKSQLETLQSIFGKEKVFDFSGKNELTEPITNFYEQSHFRPHVADTIMKVIYKNK